MLDKIEVRDIVVLLPGILGSVLGRDGEDVWAISPQAVLDAVLTGGNSLRGLGFQSAADGHKDPPPDHLNATRLFRDTHIIPYFWKIDGYGKIDTVLQQYLDLVRGENYFDFPYDWRLDNRIAAKSLKASTDEWLGRRRAVHGDDVKLILIAHSMGGLVARYFLERLEGWRDTRMLITFGTPYHGSLQALGFLVNGYPINIGPVFFDFSTVMRSFPSIYQLLPTYKAVRVGTGGLVKVRDVVEQIPNAEPDEIRDAIAFHDEIAQAVQGHQSDNAYLLSAYEKHPIVGTEQPTAVWATIGPDSRAVLEGSYPGETWTGDSTVPWISAHPGDDPRGVLEAGVYCPDRHGSLQNSDDVLLEVRNLINRLVTPPPFAPTVPPQGISLELQDWNTDGAIDIVARCSVGPVYSEVTNAATGAMATERTPLPLTGDTYRATISGLQTGTYRVTVTSDGPIPPVTDVCIVVGPT